MRKFTHKDRSQLVTSSFRIPIELQGRIRAVRMRKGITAEQIATAAFEHYLPIVEGAPIAPLECPPPPERSVRLVRAKRTQARLYKARHAAETAKACAELAKAKAEHARHVHKVKKASKASGQSLLLKLLD